MQVGQPRNRSAQSRDELAPSHSITSSTRRPSKIIHLPDAKALTSTSNLVAVHWPELFPAFAGEPAHLHLLNWEIVIGAGVDCNSGEQHRNL
jgi:hypothetical protein